MSQSAKKKSSAFGIVAAVFIIAAVAGGGIYASSLKKEAAPSTETASATAESAASIAPAQGETAPVAVTEGVSETPTATSSEAPAADPAAPVALSAADLEALLKPRILGNPEAPLKISEHSSFTCGGCAHYHSDNFKKVKTDYIDTGKAYIVYDDFPRNGVDLYVGMVARCLPEQSYFNFVQLIFETQKEWADESKYEAYVTQNAKLAGATDERIAQCLNSKELQKVLADRREAAAEKYSINSTPTLVLNDVTVTSGLVPYEKLKEAFDAEIAKKAAAGGQ